MKRNRLIALIFGAIVVLGLSGCGIDPNAIIDGYSSSIKERVALNQAEVTKIENAGLLSAEEGQSLRKAIEESTKKVESIGDADDLSAYTFRVWGELNDPHGVKANNTSKSKALTIVSKENTAVQQLMDNLNLEIYVLRKDPLNKGTEENALATLDIISKEVEKAKAGQASNIDSYFVASGRTIWDTTDPKNQIIRVTYSSAGKADAHWNQGKSYNQLGEDYIGIKEEADEDGNMQLVSKIQIPLVEFNPEVVDRLVGKDGVNQDMYVIVGSKCYLMQYPVYYIDGFKVEGTDGYKATYTKSELQVNILTKKILDSSGRECYTDDEPILQVSGDGGYNDLGVASFVVDGVKGENTPFGYERTPPADPEVFGRVVLRDYLELSYMPNVVNGEQLVALGRKVRITSMKGLAEEDMGLFIDKKGNAVENAAKIKIRNIMDKSAGDEGKKKKLSCGAGTDVTPTPDPNATDSSTTSVHLVGESQDSLLDEELVSEIKCSTMFPGDLVATGDDKLYNETSSDTTSTTTGTAQVSTTDKAKHLMYGMAIDVDIFSTNMFSGWINISGDSGDTGSLDWWNGWLNNSTFLYNIPRDKLEEFLLGNYSYEMSENNVIVLDLDTIAGIQKEFNVDKKKETASWISTMFAILGIILIGYSIVLIVAWVYDSNMVLGPRLLTLITFNRWIAVSSDEEVPQMDKKERHYMTYGNVMKAALCITAVGLILMHVDIMVLVDILVVTLGRLSQAISRKLLGI